MRFERTKNSTRNIIFGIANRLITVLCPFAIRTIIISRLGEEYLGLSDLFKSVLSVLNMSELGISVAFVYCLFKPVQDDDRETICATMALLKKLYLIIGGFIFTAGLALMPFLKYLIKGSCPADINLYVLYLIYLLNTAVSYLAFAYKDVLFTAYQRKDVIHIISSAAEILRYLAQILVLLFFRDYYLFVLMILVSTLVINILNLVVSKRMFPDIRPSGELSKEQKSLIKNKVFYYSFHKIGTTLVVSADNIIISSFLGLQALALFNNYQFISTALIGIIIIAYSAVYSSVGNSLSTESREKNLEIFNKLYFICLWIATWTSVCLLCLFQPFIKTIWIGEEYLLDFSVVIMKALFFHTNVIRQFLMIVYIDAAGLWNKTLFRQFLTAGINLILDVALARSFGIAGIMFASFFTFTFIALPLDIRVVYKYILHENVGTGFKKLLFQFTRTIVLGAATYFLCSFIPCESPAGFIAKAAVCLVFPNAVLLAFNARKPVFKELLVQARGLIKK